MGFIYRDLAARNVLVSSELRCKISDFGMSREAEESDYYQSRGGVLPVRWCSPEVLEHRKFSTRSDMWASGVLLYEIWTKGATPYGNWSNAMVWTNVTAGARLPSPKLPARNLQRHDRMLAGEPPRAAIGTGADDLFPHRCRDHCRSGGWQ